MYAFGLLPGVKEKYEADYAKWQQKCQEQLNGFTISKLGLLLQHYQISVDNPDRWLMLAHALAVDFVPGFSVQYKKSAGKKILWNSLLLAHLYHAVQQKRSSTLTSRAVCNSLAKSDPWKQYGSAKTLYNEYLKSKDSEFVNFLKKQNNTPELHDMGEYLWAALIAATAKSVHKKRTL